MRVKMRVEFYDVDSMGIVWHGNYVKFLEAARCEFLTQIGFDYTRMRELGFAYPVAKMDLKYIAPLRFKDEFFVDIKLTQIDGFLGFSYLIADINGRKICKAKTSQVCVKIDGFETHFEAPEELREIVDRQGLL